MRRPLVMSRRQGAAAAALAVVLVSCTSTPKSSSTPTSRPAPTSQSVATTTDPPPAEPGGLPVDCGALLPVTELDAALGTGLPGMVTYIRGEPLPDIGRTDRITCGYGVVIGVDGGGRAMPPQLEISISSYTDEAAAAERIDITTAARRTAGDRIETTQVQGIPATLLIGVTGTTLVFADGPLTYALTLREAVLPPERMPEGLVSVATAVLGRTTAAPTS